MEILQLSVGKKIPENISFETNGYINKVDCTNGQKVVFVGMPNINEMDLYVFQNGDLAFGCFKQDDLLVMAHSITSNEIPTIAINNEYCYHPFINEEIHYDFSKEKQLVHTGKLKQYTFTYILFDTVNRFILGIRTFTFSRKFTIQLSNMLTDISKKTMTGIDYQQQVSKIYSYAPEELVHFCTLREVIKSK